MRIIAWSFFYLSVALTGFLAVDRLLSQNEPVGPEAVDIRSEFSFTKDFAPQGVLTGGWKRSESWGTWASTNLASLEIPLDGKSRGDIVMLVQAETKVAPGSNPLKVDLVFNGSRVGTWTIPAGVTSNRWFRIPAMAFNASNPARLSLTITDLGTSAKFGLKAIRLSDATSVKAKGSLDDCSPSSVVGWAVVEGDPLSVYVVADGQPVDGVANIVVRPDLVQHGLPGDAGFNFIPTKPIAQGASVKVFYAAGRQVILRECVIG